MHKSWSSCVEIMSIEGPLRTATRAQDEDNTGTTWKASGRMDGALFLFLTFVVTGLHLSVVTATWSTQLYFVTPFGDNFLTVLV